MNLQKTTYRFLLLISLYLLTNTARAQYSEYEIKAAYIFNFAKFIQWPGSPQNDTLILGLYKTDPFGIVLDKTMQGRKAQGKSWKILRINKMQDISKCNILFISELGKYETLQILEYTKNKPILTIGDEMLGFCEMGGIVNFTPQFSEQQFEINNEAASLQRITISPKLLLLAKIISNNEDEF
jgi:hypothetical protein